MDYVMELEGLTKSYKKKTVLQDFSLNMEKGHIVGLIGPNGAGKTTLMRILAGLTAQDKGSMRFFGSEDVDSKRCRISFTLEAPYMDMQMTAYENMEYLRFLRGVPDEKRIEELLRFVGLEDTGKKKAGKFSLGMRQRLGLAMTLLPKPEILVLDEPINGLDPEGIIDIRNILLRLAKQEGITILISSHILRELSELCTDYAIIREGRLIEQLSMQELLEKCRACIVLQTMDIPATTALLEKELSIYQYKVGPNQEIMIYERLNDLPLISKTITDHGLVLTKLCMEEESLEAYYMEKAGGSHE